MTPPAERARDARHAIAAIGCQRARLLHNGGDGMHRADAIIARVGADVGLDCVKHGLNVAGPDVA